MIQNADGARDHDLPRRIGFWGASAIMVGIIIGSGIFGTPPDIAKKIASPTLILLLWAAGGAISLCGALTWAELATMFPQSGGIYVFLREGLGDAVAFVFGWTYMLISKPLSAGAIAVTFAAHLNSLLGVDWNVSLTTCVMLTVLTAINLVGVRLGSGVAELLTAMKLAALAAIIVTALFLLKGSAANFAPSPVQTPLLAGLVSAMAGILWAFDGWSDIGAVAGEVREPQRNLPAIFLVGTSIVVAIYIAINAVYLSMIPLAEMRKLDTVAPLVMERLVGGSASMLVTALIVISTLGSTHGSIITGARYTFAQAQDGLLFRVFAHVHPRFATPDFSLISQLVLACAAVIWIPGFQDLVDGFIFTMWIFYALAGVSIIVLRIRRPEIARPYRCWGYPVVPALFIAAALAMTVLAITQDPRKSLPWLGVLLIGFPVYFAWVAIARRSRASLR
jgi:APA family basic amino acid/polyamine antiporter